MSDAKDSLDNLSSFVLYTGPDGAVRIEVLLQGETLWLTQDKTAELFDKGRSTITEHVSNVFKEGELDANLVCREFRRTGSDGKAYKVNYYNLDMIIAVGYRVNSHRATQFRIWATKVLREYIIKGFVLDDERLKQGENAFGKDYFRELLERVRSIRASERRIYLQITDIFAECSIDYDPHSSVTKEFFASVQNKFHYAITGMTAAEIIDTKVDRNKEHLGLTTWKAAPNGRIISSDVTVAKNYLSESEIRKLERTISGFFDYIENLIENRQSFTMLEFSESVGKFLSFNEYRVLDGKGKISKESSEAKALAEYREFNKSQPINSDFDKMIKKLKRE